MPPSFEPWHLDLLDSLRVARLATIAPSGVPSLVPVCYALVDARIVIAVDEKPKSTTALARLRNIERDPRVSLLFDRYDDDWSQLAWVRVDGEATVSAGGGRHPESLTALRSRYPQYMDMDLEARPLISVTPTRVTAWRWAGG